MFSSNTTGINLFLCTAPTLVFAVYDQDRHLIYHSHTGTMIDLLVVACGVVRIKLLFLQRRVSLGFLRAMVWWGGSNLVSTSPDTNGEKPRVKIDTLIENALAKHDNTHRPPKQWAFQRHKLNSFEN